MIFGVSHLILSSTQFTKDTQAVEALGYDGLAPEEVIRNPLEKAPFISGLLAENAQAVLLGSSFSPPVEVMEEKHGTVLLQDSALGFAFCSDISFIPEEWLDIETVNSRLSGGPGVPPGLWGFKPRQIPSRVFLIERVDSLEGGALIWNALGMTPQKIEDGTLEVNIKRRLAGFSLLVRIVECPKMPKGFVNQSGISCLAFLCANPESIYKRLSEIGAEVGGFFELSIFGNRLKIFFARDCTGHVFEFVSPC